MAENSKIEWTDHTANLWWGCVKVRNNSLCDNCYANVLAKRVGNDIWGDDKPRRKIVDIWGKLTPWQRQAEQEGRRLKVFTMSMGDIFEKSMPLVNHLGKSVKGSTGELRSKLFESINQYPNLDFQLLTKRPQNIMRMVPEAWHTDWPDNAWVGTSIGTQKIASANLPVLAGIPAKTRFLSMEPLLEDVDIGEHISDLSWVIVGGESGHHARPTNPEHFRSIRDQCEEGGVPFFFKQWGDFDESGKRVGKNNAGMLLDGKIHQAFPAEA